MDLFDVLSMIGGLALFLYGMNTMGAGLSKMAGGKLETILERLTAKPIYGVLLGAAVTGIIQSSSATTVMVVGFVNSGIMELSRATGIIMGANIGTTVTSWLLSLTGINGTTIWLKLLKPSSFSPVLAAIGMVMIMSSKEESRKKDIGSILLGFAILMTGMENMSSSVAGLKNSEAFCGMLTAFKNPVFGLAAGAVLTAIIQSSSASVGILQALCATGAVQYAVALPIIMGQNIGTCVTAIISSIGASKNAKRASMIHLYFNVIGTLTFMLIFYALNAFLHFAFLAAPANAAGIATIHTLFNVCATIALFPFSNLLVKLATITIPDGPVDTTLSPQELRRRKIAIDERFLESPAFAMQLARTRVQEMARETNTAIHMAMGLLTEYDDSVFDQVVELEDTVDDYEDILGSYLVKLSSKNLTKNDSRSLSVMLHSISDFERISDHAINIAESAREMRDNDMTFSKSAARDMAVLCTAVGDITEKCTQVFSRDDLVGAKEIEPLEQVIDHLTKTIKQNHVRRLRKGKCTVELGLILEDLLTILERVSDHCSNVAVEMLAISEDGFETHEYFDELSENDRSEFNARYNFFKNKYLLKNDDGKIKEDKN